MQEITFLATSYLTCTNTVTYNESNITARSSPSRNTRLTSSRLTLSTVCTTRPCAAFYAEADEAELRSAAANHVFTFCSVFDEHATSWASTA